MKKTSPHTISGVFLFLLIGIFAVFAAVMALIGAQFYKSGTERTARHNTQRIACAYIRNRLRAADEQGMLLFPGPDGADYLQIENRQEGTVTLLYVHDGMLYEWYTLSRLLEQEGFDPDMPSGGESVCELDDMKIYTNGPFVSVELCLSDEWTTVDYTMRSAMYEGEQG